MPRSPPRIPSSPRSTTSTRPTTIGTRCSPPVWLRLRSADGIFQQLEKGGELRLLLGLAHLHREFVAAQRHREREDRATFLVRRFSGELFPVHREHGVLERLARRG